MTGKWVAVVVGAPLCFFNFSWLEVIPSASCLFSPPPAPSLSLPQAVLCETEQLSESSQ